MNLKLATCNVDFSIDFFFTLLQLNISNYMYELECLV